MKIEVHAAAVEHGCGTNLYMGASVEAVDAQVAGFCRDWWPHEWPDEPMPGDQQELIAQYFEKHDTESVVRFDPQTVQVNT